MVSAVDLLVRLLGRQRAWRLGRKLYMTARGEMANKIDVNGEAVLARDALSALPAPEGFVAWDVGANLGLWTAALLDAADQLSRELRVDLFEPSPAAATATERRFADRGNVQVHRLALSATGGTMPFEMPDPQAGTSTLALTGRPGAEVIDVEVKTGAAMAEELGIGHIHLLKIDAEGHDLEVLQGFEPLFRRAGIDVAQFEYNWRWLVGRHSMRELFMFADTLGYHVAQVGPQGLTVFEQWNAENDRYFEFNYALVRPAVLPLLRHSRTRWDASNVPVPVEPVKAR